MLSNPTLTRIMATVLCSFGCFLAVYNTLISAVVIQYRSGIVFLAALGIAVGLTVVELWFASWARDLKNLRNVVKLFKRNPAEIGTKLFAGGLGLAAVYHYDILSTTASVGPQATDPYFFLWAVAWLVFGPELAVSLTCWLWQCAMDRETKVMAETNTRAAENAYRRNQRSTMCDMAAEKGRIDGVAKAIERFGEPAMNGSGRYSP